MKLTLLSKSEYTTLTLPQKIAGHYWLRGSDTNGKSSDIVCVDAVRSAEEGTSDRWVMKSNRRYEIIGSENSAVPVMVLDALELYRARNF